MNWGKIVEQIPAVIDRIRKDYLLQNMTIKDDIFGILEKLCVVVYYPLENEVNCGFHTKRFVKDRLEDFVYINTAKPLADQVFAAAHELGHVWGVAIEVWEAAGETEALTIDEEERIINRFAAELLMPGDEFKKTFWAHMREQKLIPNQVKVEDLVRVMVMQMNDYMVPYESVRRRMIETDIVSMIHSLLCFYILYELRMCECISRAAENIIRSQITSEALETIEEMEIEQTNQIRREKKSKLVKKTVENFKKMSSEEEK